MKTSVLVFITILVLILQSSVVQSFELFGATPDLRIIWVVMIALKRGSIVGASVGFFSGLVLDVYGLEHLGATALAGAVMGYLAGLANEHVIELDRYSKLFFLGLFFLGHDVLFFFTVKSSEMSFLEMLSIKTMPNGLYTLLVGSVFIYSISSGFKEEHA